MAIYSGIGWPFLILVLGLTGCAAPTTVVSRRQEKAAAYQALSPEFREAADRGALKAGMPADAVYIAWGAPAQVLQRGSAAGEETIWIYTGGFMQETRYWGYHRLHSDYTPRTYVRAEVVFSQGVVSSWRTLPEPVD